MHDGNTVILYAHDGRRIGAVTLLQAETLARNAGGHLEDGFEDAAPVWRLAQPADLTAAAPAGPDAT